MQQPGASRRLSSRWAQPAGRLRGVLVKWGTDEASVHFGAVRRILGLHPARQKPYPLAGQGRSPLGPGQSLPEPASPPLLPLSKRHAHTLRREECPGRLAQMANITHRQNYPESQLDSRSTRKNLFNEVFGTVVFTLLTFSIHWQKQKQLMGGCVTPRWIAIGPRQHVKPSAPSFQLVELFKASDSLDSTDVKSNKSRLLGWKKMNKNGWLAN